MYGVSIRFVNSSPYVGKIIAAIDDYQHRITIGLRVELWPAMPLRPAFGHVLHPTLQREIIPQGLGQIRSKANTYEYRKRRKILLARKPATCAFPSDCNPTGMASTVRRPGARVKSKAEFSSLRRSYDAARKELRPFPAAAARG